MSVIGILGAGNVARALAPALSAAGHDVIVGARDRVIGLSEYRDRLLAADRLLPFQPPMLASIASSVRHGYLANTGPDLQTLLGRPATDPLSVAVEAASGQRRET